MWQTLGLHSLKCPLEDPLQAFPKYWGLEKNSDKNPSINVVKHKNRAWIVIRSCWIFFPWPPLHDVFPAVFSVRQLLFGNCPTPVKKNNCPSFKIAFCSVSWARLSGSIAGICERLRFHRLTQDRCTADFDISPPLRKF